MTTKTINCVECSVEFTFEENPKFPRKYCLNCSALKKKQWTGMSKTEAKETPDDGMGTPVEKITGEIRTKSNGKEYHLSPELGRAHALRCSIEAKIGLQVYENIGVLDLAGQFEEWINGQS